MKKLLFCIALLVFINVTYSQTTEDEQKISIDSMIVNLDTSALTSSFLYDRTSSLTDLKNFNTSEKNTATLSFFEQALEELYNASNQKKFISYRAARQFYRTINDYNNVEIGIIHADFQSLNYNDDATKSALKIEGKKLIKINEKPLFIDHEILIAAPLLEYVIGPDINFHFKPDLWFEDTNNPIQNLVANFSVGSTYAIYTNGHYTQKKNIHFIYRRWT